MEHINKKGKEKGLSFFGHVIRRISCAFFISVAFTAVFSPPIYAVPEVGRN